MSTDILDSPRPQRAEFEFPRVLRGASAPGSSRERSSAVSGRPGQVIPAVHKLGALAPSAAE